MSTQVVHPSDIVMYLINTINHNIADQNIVVEYLRVQAHYTPYLYNAPVFMSRLWLAYSGIDAPWGHKGGSIVKGTKIHIKDDEYGMPLESNITWRSSKYSKLRRGRYYLKGRPVCPYTCSMYFFVNDFPGIRTQILLRKLNLIKPTHVHY